MISIRIVRVVEIGSTVIKFTSDKFAIFILCIFPLSIFVGGFFALNFYSNIWLKEEGVPKVISRFTPVLEV